MSDKTWIGFDLDGTLAEYHGFQGIGVIGTPIPSMVKLVQKYLSEGKTVKILTARVASTHEYSDRIFAQAAITAWCRVHIGVALPVTAEKDQYMVTLYDDRAIHVEENTGRIIG